jgi:hypothetical protein
LDVTAGSVAGGLRRSLPGDLVIITTTGAGLPVFDAFSIA